MSPAPPARRLAVVCFGLERDRVRRQPWHVAIGLALGLRALGHDVRIITDAADPPCELEVPVIAVDHLLEHGRASVALRNEIAAYRSERAFLIGGALAVARLRELCLSCATSIVMASPKLHPGEILRLGLPTLLGEGRLLLLPLVNALLPGFFLCRGFGRSGADDIVYLSAATRQRYAALGLPVGRLLRPQVDAGLCLGLPPPSGPVTLCYLGPPLELRGAGLALQTFERVVERGLDARLMMLLRPDGGDRALRRLLERIERSPSRERIEVETAMLPSAELRHRLARTHLFLLPFQAPVSEVPLVVVEAGLSGRRLVVLDAPGVAEVARAMGGVVAPTPERLPDAVIEALENAAAGPPPSAEAWTRWDRACAALLAEQPWQLRMIAVCGVDGSGKTALVEALSRHLAAAGIPHRHVWSRFRNYLSKPLLALTRLSGHNRKEQHGGFRIGYHDFAASRPLALLFLFLQLIDTALDIVGRFRLGSGVPILADRCALDTLVDLAVDTGLDDLVLDRAGPLLLRLLPQPRLAVLIERSPALIARQRPDALADRHFARRRALYARLARSLGMPVLTNDGPLEVTLEALLALACPAQPTRERAA